jgi:hypothetical protein
MTLVQTSGRSKRYALMYGGELVSTAELQDGDYLATSLVVVESEDDNDFLGSVPVDALPPLPPQGTWLEAGDLYADGDRAVLVRQPHERTGHPVDDLIPSHFLVHRPDVDGIGWIAGEPVTIGTIRTYEGVEYVCIQPHVTQDDWQPPNVPSLWSVVSEPIDEWQAGVSYDIGDVVIYNGTEYECLQAHTAQVGWEPPNTPALWSAL